MPGTYDQESKGNDNSLNQGQKPEEKVPAGQQKGVLMLANPSDRDLWIYPDPSNKNNYSHHPTPLSVRVDESDVKKAKRGDKDVEFIKVTEIPDEKVTNPGYARKASIQSYAAFQALDHFGITDETERNIFMANADHESGRCTTLAEGTNYTDPTRWSGINGQSAAVARAYGEKFTEVFSKWTAQDKANNMYGIEGKNFAESKGEKPKSGKWTADSLSNTQNDDGWRFRGRGVIQITGRGHFTDLNNNLNAVDPATGETNYEKASGNKGKKVDVVKNPELVTEDQFIAYYSGAWFWKSVAQGRISNTLAKNSATLGGASSLAAVKDSATAVKIGRKAVAGNSTDLSVNPHGLDKVQTNYSLDAAKYSAAYANYKAEQGNGGSVSGGAVAGVTAGASAAVEAGTAAVSAGTQQAQDVTGTNQPVVENTAPAASVSSGLEINAEGHPIYYPKGAQDTKDRIKWNRDRNYTTEYIKSFQKLIGTDPDGDIGTNTVNAIRHYQELNGLEQDGKWGRECATASGLERKYIGDASTGAGSSSGTTTVDGGTLPEVTVIGEKPSGDQQSGGQQQTSGTDISAHETSADSYSIISTNPDATAATKYHSGIPSDAVPMRITGNKNTKDGFIHPVKDHLAYYVSAENGWSDKTGNLDTKAGSFTVKDSECSPVDSYQSHKTLQYIRNYQVGDEVKISSAGRFLKDTSSEAKENRVEVYNNDFVSKIESIEEGPTGKFYQVKYHDKLGFVHCRYVTQSSNEISPEQLQVLQANANNWLGYNTRELSNSNSEYSKYITWSTNYSRNCANFVSYQLMCAGILDKVYPGCSGLSSALKDKGWGSKLKKDAVKDEHKPEYGDVWFSNGMGHTELVTSTSGTTVNLIGSNNRDHNSQVVSKSSAGDNDHIYSRFYK